jgi:hypothetical protein
VPDHDFFFALDISDEPEFDRMLGELASVVFGYVGYPASAADELTSVLRAALASRVASGRRRCDIRFLAGAGELEIVVACAGSPEWRTTRPLPAS